MLLAHHARTPSKLAPRSSPLLSCPHHCILPLVLSPPQLFRTPGSRQSRISRTSRRQASKPPQHPHPTYPSTKLPSPSREHDRSSSGVRFGLGFVRHSAYMLADSVSRLTHNRKAFICIHHLHTQLHSTLHTLHTPPQLRISLLSSLSPQQSAASRRRFALCQSRLVSFLTTADLELYRLISSFPHSLIPSSPLPSTLSGRCHRKRLAYLAIALWL